MKGLKSFGDLKHRTDAFAIDRESGCWVWKGSFDAQGYGRIACGKTRRRAHRAMFEAHGKTIPDGLTLDHLCRNRACVNPDHLEPVTQGVNSLRGDSPWSVNARKTHCKRGHEFDDRNTISYRGTRRCRECKRKLERERFSK